MEFSFRFKNGSEIEKKGSGSSHDSRSSSGFGAIELAENVESGDEAYEAKTHDEDNGRGYLQAWSIVGVESEHVASGIGSNGGGGG